MGVCAINSGRGCGGGLEKVAFVVIKCILAVNFIAVGFLIYAMLNHPGKELSLETVGATALKFVRGDTRMDYPRVARRRRANCSKVWCPFGYALDVQQCGRRCQLESCCHRKERALCTTMVCPPGFALKENAKNLSCEWHMCASEIRKSQPDRSDMFDTCQCCDASSSSLSVREEMAATFGLKEIPFFDCVSVGSTVKQKSRKKSRNATVPMGPSPTSFHCYGAGNRFWPPPAPGDFSHSRSFGISNVKLSRGVAILRSKGYASKCLYVCEPTFWDNQEQRGEIRKFMTVNESEAGACIAFDKAALVTDTKWPNNLYHWVFDNIFLIYLHLEEYSLYLGMDKNSIDIAGLRGPPQSNFIELWTSVMRRPIQKSQLNGCYRSVIFGGMWNQRMVHFPWTTRKFLADPVIMARMSAFSANQRSFFVPLMESMSSKERALLRRPATAQSRPEVIHSCKVIVAGHERMPVFMKRYNWSSGNVGNGSCAIYREMDLYTIKEQLLLAMNAEAMVGVLGAQFSWQVWMKVTSPILVIQAPFITKFPLCGDVPESWHETTAVHCGRTSVSWRFCGNNNDFEQAQPVGLINFTMGLAGEAAADQQAFTCIILRQMEDARRHNVPWPQCDVHVSMPWGLTGTSSCRWSSTYTLVDGRSMIS